MIRTPAQFRSSPSFLSLRSWREYPTSAKRMN